MTTATNNPIPSLALAKSIPKGEWQNDPVERDIPRRTLVDIAPDREDFIMRATSIEHIRESLKIHAYGQDHWLFQARTRYDCRIRDPTMRVALHELKPICTRERRSFSITQLNQLSSELSQMRRTPQPPPSPAQPFITPTATRNTIIQLDLSTPDKLISPRPIGPTHMIIAYSTEPLSGVYSKVLECPINDLLFAANCPNLMPDPTSKRKLPHRLPKHLVRVLLHVRNLETFGSLVVYLHTKNQAALFRALVPQWIHDIVHPLPVPRRREPSPLAVSPVSLSPSGSGRHCIANSIKYLDNSYPGGFLDREMSLKSITVVPTQSDVRTLDSVARELVNAENILPSARRRAGDLAFAYEKVNQLKENLDLIGHFGKDLWTELEVTRDILEKAMKLKPKTAGPRKETGSTMKARTRTS